MKICRTLNIKMDELIELSSKESQEDQRPNFEIFKSNVCHEVKRKGDISFIK